MSASSLNLSWGHKKYRSEENVEQQRGKDASLTKPLCHLLRQLSLRLAVGVESCSDYLDQDLTRVCYE